MQWLPDIDIRDVRLHPDRRAAGVGGCDRAGACRRAEQIERYLRALAESVSNGSRVDDLQPCCDSCPADVLNSAAAAIARAGTSGGGS
jgi:hypothetical protein